LLTQNSVNIQLIISTVPGATANKRNETLHRDLLGGNDSED